jgi:hypothetical protein
MLRKLAIALAAVVSLGVASMPTGAFAAHGGGGGGGHGGGFGGGHGGFGGGFSHGGFSGGFGGRSLGGGLAPGFANRGITGGNAFVGRGVTGNAFVGRNFVRNGFVGHGRFASINGHRFLGRRIYGFLPGYGYGYYWYDDGCYAWTDYGYVNLCYPNDYYYY